jgi:16S rRNA (guanine966-N2)-methyltransferase
MPRPGVGESVVTHPAYALRVTRIIAGFAGSRELKVPAAGTRPTSDRVREAIFSALEARDAIAGMAVLDLYAGSGALALEALSRGASRAVMVEKNPKAAAIATGNCEIVRTAGKLDASTTKVVASSVSSFLSSTTDRFDLVFIDPPYDLGNAEIEACLLALVPLLNEYGEVMVERSSRDAELTWPAGLALTKAKAYGETTIYWLELESAS